MSKSVFYYKPQPKDDIEIEKALQEKANNTRKKVFGRPMTDCATRENFGTINVCIESMYH